MLRRNAHTRPPLPTAANDSGPSSTDVRQSVARAVVAIGRVLLAPLALALAAIAGLVYALLLPICGIASVAEATARASWALVRDAFRRPRHRAASRA